MNDRGSNYGPPAMFEGFHLSPSSREGVFIIFKNLDPGLKKNS